jgi:flagellar biosynthesis chaperone FliJ
MKYDRWMTLFYAKMLVMLIHWQIYHLVKQAKFRTENKLLSISKSIKSLQLACHKITALIHKGQSKFKQTIEELIEMIEKRHDLERKKNRKCQQEIIDIIYCMSAS